MRLHVFFVVGLFAAIASTAQGEVRKWTDKSGSFSVQAEFVELAGEQVVLKREDSKSIRVPLEKLSSADQEFVRQKTAAKPENPFAVSGESSASPSKPSQTTSLGEGKGDDTGTLREVIATGQGTTEDEAKRAAFHNAVEQAVGVYVDATTIANNEKLIEDSVLTYSNAYIKSFTVVRSSTANGVQTVKIKAMVKVQRLAEKLQSQGIKTVAVDGQSLVAEIVTTKRRDEDGATLLKKAMGDFPLQFVEFVPSGEVTPNKKGGLDTTIHCGIKLDAYRKYVDDLDKVLKLLAKQHGSENVPLYRNSLLISHYSEHYWSKAAQEQECIVKKHNRHESNSPDSYGFLVGKSVTRSKKRNDSSTLGDLSLDWYALSADVGRIPINAWERSTELVLRCCLEGDGDQTVAEKTIRPCRDYSRDKGTTPLTPGGLYAIDVSGYDLILAYGHPDGL